MDIANGMTHTGKRTRISVALLVAASAGLAAAPTAFAQGSGAVTEDRSAVALFGKIDATVGESRVVTKTGETAVERGFIDVTLPAVLDTIAVDDARLILSVSTVFDSTEPLLIAAFPATVPTGSRTEEWSSEWDEMSGGFDPEHMAFVSVDTTESNKEISIDITEFVLLWKSGEIPNYGVVIKTLSENKSTYHWLRDGRYSGQDAKVEIWYSRLD